MEATQTQNNNIKHRFTPEYNSLITKFRNKVRDVLKERGLRATQLEYELWKNNNIDAKNGIVREDTDNCYFDVIKEYIERLEAKASTQRKN